MRSAEFVGPKALLFQCFSVGSEAQCRSQQRVRIDYHALLTGEASGRTAPRGRHFRVHVTNEAFVDRRVARIWLGPLLADERRSCAVIGVAAQLPSKRANDSTSDERVLPRPTGSARAFSSSGCSCTRASDVMRCATVR